MENKTEDINLKEVLGEEVFLMLEIREHLHRAQDNLDAAQEKFDQHLGRLAQREGARDTDTIQHAKGEIKELTEQLTQLKSRNENGKE